MSCTRQAGAAHCPQVLPDNLGTAIRLGLSSVFRRQSERRFTERLPGARQPQGHGGLKPRRQLPRERGTQANVPAASLGSLFPGHLWAMGRATLFPVCALLSLLASQLFSDTVSISFDSIEGAKRYDRTSRTWELACGGPTQLFRDSRPVHIEEMALRLGPGADPVTMCTVDGVLPELRFTCAIELDECEGGVLSVQLAAADGRPLGKRACSFGRKGVVSATFCVEGELPAGAGALTLTVSASGPVTVRKVIFYRTFDQLFYLDSPFPLLGATYRKYGNHERRSLCLLPSAIRDHRTKQWRVHPSAVEDGIEVGNLAKHYYTLLCVKKGTLSGIRFPISTPGGGWLCWRGKGRYTLTLMADGIPKYKYRNFPMGKHAEWRSQTLSMDPTFLDSDRNGIWSGHCHQAWHRGNTLIQNYATGMLDYIVVLPQNRIPLPIEGATTIEFRYLNRNRKLETCSSAVPKGAEAVGFVHVEDHVTRLLWQVRDEWREGIVVKDSLYANKLSVEADSILCRAD